MEKKINLVELLKDCPQGMELDCPLFEKLEFDRIDKNNGAYPIICRVKTEYGSYNCHTFTEYGCYCLEKYGKCVIFPKGKTNWEGFQIPFKDGDIVFYDNTIAIFKEWGDETLFRTYCALYTTVTDPIYQFEMCRSFFGKYIRKETRFATEEEKQKLFNAIKIKGYKWNEKTKTFEKLIEPNFKDGDIVATDTGHWIGITEGGKKDSFIPTYCVLKSDGQFEAYFDEKRKWCFYRLATEEEKTKLFQAIKDNGYKWNSETKTLEKLIEPKFMNEDIVVKALKDIGYKWSEETKSLEKLIKPNFKVGDKIRLKHNRHISDIIVDITENQYVLSFCDQRYLDFKYQDKFELVPNKFDFSTLIPFESKVLVRDTNTDYWLPDVYGGRNEFNCFLTLYKERSFYKCIPYEGNEHLLGTTNDCDNFYKL